MVGCSILGCKNRSENCINGLSFHSFPQAYKNIWIAATGRRDWEPTKNSKICSIHFKDHELKIKEKRTRLVRDAVPTVHLTLFKSAVMDKERQSKIWQYLTGVERLSHEIFAARREMVLLDKRRNQNREALRALKNSDQTNCYITVGSVLIKNTVEQSISLLEADQIQLNIDINKLRTELKDKVNEMRDLEMQPPVAGSSIIPISEKY